MSKLAPRLASVAFVGLWLWSGAAARPALASETGALPPPAARLGEALACRILAPRFQPGGSRADRAEAASFPGGAKLRFLVAAPCPRRRNRRYLEGSMIGTIAAKSHSS